MPKDEKAKLLIRNQLELLKYLSTGNEKNYESFASLLNKLGIKQVCIVIDAQPKTDEMTEFEKNLKANTLPVIWLQQSSNVADSKILISNLLKSDGGRSLIIVYDINTASVVWNKFAVALTDNRYFSIDVQRKCKMIFNFQDTNCRRNKEVFKIILYLFIVEGKINRFIKSFKESNKKFGEGDFLELMSDVDIKALAIGFDKTLISIDSKC